MARRNRPDPDEVLARITPQPIRRGLATGMLGLLGFLLLSVAARTPPQSPAYLVLLVVLGAGALWLAWRLWQASGVTLELTRTEMREAGGRRLFAVADVDRVDNSAFAFKPAAGFLVHLRAPMARAYAPGLWWRAGRRVAIGGVTARVEGKGMVELLNVMLADREGGFD